MTNAEQREAARKFINIWRGKGYEKGDTQRFWMSLLSDVLGVNYVADKIEFEKEVVIDGQTKFIDAYIAETKVLIEQKSLTKGLKKAILQSGGKYLTPYEQAKNYANHLPVDDAPRWIVTCNFEEFHIYDMNKPGTEPEIVLLENLQTEIYRFSFLLNKKTDNISKEMEISIQAGDLVGQLYDALLEEYKDPTNPESLKSLNALCVRLVFCLYAEDAGIFGRHGMFHDYLMRFEIRDLRKALIELFQVLDIKPEDRDPYMDEELAAFPYVNGGLFSDTNIEIPQLTEEIRELVLKKASEDFDWSEISPTIFGAVFESTLNPETRRAGGMHYTSTENIHKVIDPLFIDELKAELEDIKAVTVVKTKKKKLNDFQDKLAGLTFLDPACGSGNFLTESYLSLRKIENQVLSLKMELEKGQVAGQIMFGDLDGVENPIKVSIGQFYGIEINDFAVTVAKTALWIAESQMMKETEDVIHLNLDFLPLKSYANIVEGNALRMDWNDVISKEELDYIMGNPPFAGSSIKSKAEQQKKDKEIVFGDLNAGKLDYVACWYKKAADYIRGTKIDVAFVSTNSITQGEQVRPLWEALLNNGICINFAYRTFRWDSEAHIKAQVHCVIICFSCISHNDKFIIDSDYKKKVQNINGYLVDAPNFYITSRGKAPTGLPKLTQGNKPWDDGGLILTPDEKKELLAKYPALDKYVKRYMGSKDYINDIERYCFWFLDGNPDDYRKIPEIKERFEKVVAIRAKSPTVAVQKQADTPMLFSQIRQPKTDFILVPETSSSARRYIPMGFMSPDTIVSNSVMTAENASLYMFGVLMSNVHMAWVRTLCGRLKSDYRYSPALYNNFPWPTPTEEQKNKIEKSAQAILDARELYENKSLADLYDEQNMHWFYKELLRAHTDKDRAVMQAYGFDVKKMSEADCVAELMKMYQELTK